MKIAVTGYEGNIGSELVKKGYIPLECDVTDADQVNDTVSKVNPDVIIHCAAMTDVTWCEKNEKKAFGVNVRGTANVMEAFKGKLFIYLSSVHVFDGEKYFAYSERHKPNPINAYGMTKFAGEMVTKSWGNPFIILRVSKTFDEKYMRPTLEVLRNSKASVVFTDLIKRSFVYTPHLVEGISWVAENQPDVRLLNVSGKDTVSYYHFWVQAANILGLDEKRVIPRKKRIPETPRPFRGGLSVKKAQKLGVPLYSFIDGLKMIKENM